MLPQGGGWGKGGYTVSPFTVVAKIILSLNLSDVESRDEINKYTYSVFSRYTRHSLKEEQRYRDLSAFCHMDGFLYGER